MILNMNNQGMSQWKIALNVEYAFHMLICLIWQNK